MCRSGCASPPRARSGELRGARPCMLIGSLFQFRISCCSFAFRILLRRSSMVAFGPTGQLHTVSAYLGAQGDTPEHLLPGTRAAAPRPPARASKDGQQRKLPTTSTTPRRTRRFVSTPGTTSTPSSPNTPKSKRGKPAHKRPAEMLLDDPARRSKRLRQLADEPHRDGKGGKHMHRLMDDDAASASSVRGVRRLCFLSTP